MKEVFCIACSVTGLVIVPCLFVSTLFLFIAAFAYIFITNMCCFIKIVKCGTTEYFV